MKSKSLVFYLLGIIFIFSCQNGSTNQSTDNDSAISSDSELMQPSSENNNQTESYLIIHGKDIWVRDIPETGKVVLKLNKGDKCRVLEKGKLAAVHGRPDYWYKIEFDNTEGWVFGSQTDLMLFAPVDGPIKGDLIANCDNPELGDYMAPPSSSYVLNDDKTFKFTVAAGYIVEGKYDWSDNCLTFKTQKLIMDSPDGTTTSGFNGSISFNVFIRDQLICLALKENKLSDKNYGLSDGCFCLNN